MLRFAFGLINDLNLLYFFSVVVGGSISVNGFSLSQSACNNG